MLISTDFDKLALPKKIRKEIIFILAFLIILLVSLKITNPNNIEVVLNGTFPEGATATIYYSHKGKVFSPDNRIQKTITNIEKKTIFNIQSRKFLTGIRIDPTQEKGTFILESLIINKGSQTIKIDSGNFHTVTTNINSLNIQKMDGAILIMNATSTDPNFEIQLTDYFQKPNNIELVEYWIVSLFISIFITLIFKYLISLSLVFINKFGATAFYSTIFNTIGIIILAYSLLYLIKLHPWWNLKFISNPMENDGTELVISEFAQDSKLLMSHISNELPISLDFDLKSKLINYSIEEHLYPRRLVQESNFILSNTGKYPSINCVIYKSHGSASIYDCK